MYPGQCPSSQPVYPYKYHHPRQRDHMIENTNAMQIADSVAFVPNVIKASALGG